MPTTTAFLLPYPNESDPADVPVDMQKLAAAADSALALMTPLTQKAAANGVATLDGSGHVPAAQLNLPSNLGGAAVAATVAGLGAGADGKLGVIVTANDLILLTYSATLAKWVSNPFAWQPGGPIQSAQNYVRFGSDLYLRWAELAAAGLKIQSRAFFQATDNSNDQNGAYARMVSYVNSVPIIGGTSKIGAVFGVAPNSYGATTGAWQDWLDMTPVAGNFAFFEMQVATTDAAGHLATFQGGYWLRYTS